MALYSRPGRCPRFGPVGPGTLIGAVRRTAGEVTADDLGYRVEENMDATETYEVAYELANRPGWVDIPLNGLLNLIETEHDA